MNTTTTKNKPTSVFKIKNFVPFIVARFFFMFAAQMQFTLIIWETYSITKNPMYLGYLSIAELVPAFLLAFYGGYIVDKYNRRTIFNTSLIITCISSTFLFCCLLLNIKSYSLIIAMMIVIFNSGIIRVFASSSQTALLGQIVPKELYGNAVTWHSGVWQAAIVLGPPTFGLCYKIVGFQYSQLIVCLMFLTSLFFSFQINKKDIVLVKTSTDKFLKSIQTGWKFMWNCKELLGAFTLDMFAVLFGSATALLPVFVADVFHGGPGDLGLLRAATAIGTIFIILFLTFNPLKKYQGYILFGTIFCYGICMILFGYSGYFWLSFALLLLSGIFDGVNVIIRSTILQTKTPDEIKGKVSAISTLFIMSSNEIGALESSIATKFLGLQPAVIFGGIATIIVVIAVYIFIPQLRKLNY